MKRGKAIAIVPRKTVAAICRSEIIVAEEAPEVPVVQQEKRDSLAMPSFLDELARSLSGKSFARLGPYEQEHVRSLAARLERQGDGSGHQRIAEYPIGE